jgi:hypothetical protein
MELKWKEDGTGGMGFRSYTPFCVLRFRFSPASLTRMLMALMGFGFPASLLSFQR